MSRYIYIILSGGAGLINMIAIFIAVSSLNTSDSDYFLLSLSFVNFCVVLFGSPLNTGKLKFVHNECLDKDVNTVSDYIFFKLIRFSPLLFILILSFYCILLYYSDVNVNSIYDVIAVALCSLFSIVFEFCRIDRQIERSFLSISSSIMLINLILLTYILSFNFSPLFYFVLLTLLRSGFSGIEILRRLRRYGSSMCSIDNEGIMRRFFNMVRFYWLSVLITALSGFLPGYFLSFFQSGYLTVYQLAYRVITAPLSLVITPFVDYIRYNVGKEKITLSTYLSSIGTMMTFSGLIICGCFFLSGHLSEQLISDSDYESLFRDTLILLSFCLIPGSIYILNTRISELGFCISTMSAFGLLIHSFYILLISIFAYLSNFDMFVISKLIVDFFMFLPVSFFFLFKSNRIFRFKGEKCEY
ncbi:hypothetical protein BZG12_16365 [Salinivibrio kushneri]|nr:hypothetical protein BZG12_16365 [Salinivibrio kushneri]